MEEDKYLFTDEDKQWINKNIYENEDVSVNGNDTYRPLASFKLTKDKIKIITEINSYNYQTPIFKITLSLEELFKECESRPGHWSYIAQQYSPRVINRIINFMIKQYNDWQTLQNPAAYFTSLIKYRKRKKKYRRKEEKS